MNVYDRGFVILRETQKATPAKREFRTAKQTWSAKIEDAQVYFDEVAAWELVRRFSTMTKHRFVNANGYTLFTSIKRAEVQVVGDTLVLIEPPATGLCHFARTRGSTYKLLDPARVKTSNENR